MRIGGGTRLALSALAVLLAGPAAADAPVFLLDQTQLPFDLGPGHPANSPARAQNAPHAAWHSAANSANGATAWENRPDNPANEARLLITADGGVLGYYAPNAGGVLNFFDVTGARIAYRPARGTRSVFAVDGTWCGTSDGTRDGGFALGLTPGCAARFGR